MFLCQLHHHHHRVYFLPRADEEDGGVGGLGGHRMLGMLVEVGVGVYSSHHTPTPQTAHPPPTTAHSAHTSVFQPLQSINESIN